MLMLQAFIKSDHGQDPRLYQKIQQHAFFLKPSVSSIVDHLVRQALSPPSHSEDVTTERNMPEAGFVNDGSFFPASFQQN